MVLLGLLIALGAYGGWYFFAERRPAPLPESVPADEVIAPPKSAASPAESSSAAAGAAGGPESAGGGSAASGASPAPATTAATTTSGGATNGGTNGLAPGSAAGSAPLAPSPSSSAPAVTSPEPGPASSPSPAAPAGPVPGGAGAPTAAGGSVAPAAPPPPVQNGAQSGAAARVVLRAHADSWVEVKDPAGKVILNRVLHAGDQWTPPEGAAGLTLTTGNAGGLDVLVDGHPLPPLGGMGVVRRNLRLDPDLLRAEAGPGGMSPALSAGSSAPAR